MIRAFVRLRIRIVRSCIVRSFRVFFVSFVWSVLSFFVRLRTYCKLIRLHFQQYFSYIVAVGCIGGGNGRTRRKPPTCHKVTDKFYHIMLYRVRHPEQDSNSQRQWRWALIGYLFKYISQMLLICYTYQAKIPSLSHQIRLHIQTILDKSRFVHLCDSV
jgi:hypothetical protein